MGEQVGVEEEHNYFIYARGHSSLSSPSARAESHDFETEGGKNTFFLISGLLLTNGRIALVFRCLQLA